MRPLMLLLPILLAISILEILYCSPPSSDEPEVRMPRSRHLIELVLPLLEAASLYRLRDPIREVLRTEVLPEFWQQPWLWDRARREALKDRTA